MLRERGVEVFSKPWTPLVAFKAPQGARERLEARGWILYPTAAPGGLRYVAKWCHTVRDLGEIAEAIIGA
jgi:tyrosine decarboxylase/aspartate 1-decarboxylase